MSGMLREVLAGAESDLVSDTEVAVASVSRAEAEHAALSGKQSAAEADLCACTSAREVAKAKFCEANLAMQVASHGSISASNARAAIDTEAKEATVLSKALEAAMRDNYPPLLEGTNSAKHLAVLQPLIHRVPLDASLAKAFPVAASKKAEDRGPFDKVALKQLQTAFMKHAAMLATVSTTSDGKVGELRATEEAAEKLLEEARSQQRVSAAALREADLDCVEAQYSVGAAVELEREVADAIVGAKADCVVRRRDLEEFRAGPLVAFDALCTSFGIYRRRPETSKLAMIPVVKAAP